MAHQNKKPVLVLVHGAWHSPAHFGPLISYLEKHEYKCVAVSLPSVIEPDLSAPNVDVPTSMQPDSDAIRRVVLHELENGSGSNVAVVAHSYGGLPSGPSLKGLDRKSRQTAGHKTYVSSVVLIAAILYPAGTNRLEAVGGKPAQIHDIRSYGDKQLVYVGQPGPKYYFYNDISDEEAEKWSSILRPQSWHACIDQITDRVSDTYPTSYLVCLRDNAVPLSAQRRMIEQANMRSPELSKIRVEEFDTSHSPFLSVPDRTGEFIRRSVGEDV